MNYTYSRPTYRKPPLKFRLEEQSVMFHNGKKTIRYIHVMRYNFYLLTTKFWGTTDKGVCGLQGIGGLTVS